jgi:ubiquinone/menaquinone biosynthesis C-methylase UbiE
MRQNSQSSSDKKKEIEAEAWRGVSDFDLPPSRLSDIYAIEHNNFLLNRSIQHFDLHSKKIINVGGGHGKEAEFLIENGAKEVVIVDIASGQLKSAKIRKAKHNLDALDIILGDGESLPFKDKVFDLGYISMALHHFPDHNKSISEICRISKEVIFVDIVSALITRTLNFFGFFRKEWCGIEPNRLNEKEVKSILNNQKIEAKITYFFIPPYYGNNVLILRCIKFISRAINFVICRSKRIALIFGNVAIIEGKA